MTEFSKSRSVDDLCQTCEQGNLFYVDMPEKIYGRVPISCTVNGNRTPVLPRETVYSNGNTLQETNGLLQIHIDNHDITITEDVRSLGPVSRARDLKIMIGSENPEDVFIASPSGERLRRAKELIRTRGTVRSPVSKLSRIEQIEMQQELGQADLEAEEELNQIIRSIEQETGEYYMVPTQDDIVVIQIPDRLRLPEGIYDIGVATEEVLDKIGNTILGVFDESFENIINLLEQGGSLAMANLPPAIVEYLGAMKVLNNIADIEVASVLRQGGKAGSRASGSLIGALRRNPVARSEFKREFIKSFLRQDVVNIKIFPSGHTVLGMKVKSRVRTSFGTFRLRGIYKTSFFEASAKVTGGNVGATASGAFKGFALIGVAVIVYNEVSDFLNDDTGGDWSDLFVGLGVEVAKTVVSAIIGGVITAVVLTGLGFIATITAPVWVVIGVGAALGIFVGAVINMVDDRYQIKQGAKNLVNDFPKVDRHGAAIPW